MADGTTAYTWPHHHSGAAGAEAKTPRGTMDKRNNQSLAKDIFPNVGSKVGRQN